MTMVISTTTMTVGKPVNTSPHAACQYLLLTYWKWKWSDVCHDATRNVVNHVGVWKISSFEPTVVAERF